MPRHPPCALTHLTTPQDARIHYATLNTQPHPTPTPAATTNTHARVRQPQQGAAPRTHPPRCLLRTQQHAKLFDHIRPVSDMCSTQPHPHPAPQQTHDARSGVETVKGDPTQHNQQTSHNSQPTSQPSQGTPSTRWLLRKEVIQPHLPVRLPCYDFVPIASPTFDNSPPQAG